MFHLESESCKPPSQAVFFNMCFDTEFQTACTTHVAEPRWKYLGQTYELFEAAVVITSTKIKLYLSIRFCFK